MKRFGLDSLVSREANEIIDLDALEKEYEVQLPDEYKIFAKYYKLGLDSLKKEDFWDSKREINVPLLSYYFGENESYLGLDYFLDVREACIGRSTDASQLSSAELNLLKIASTTDAGGGGVYIGLNQENHGKIYRVTWDRLGQSDGVTEVANNIFEFLIGIKSTELTLNRIDFKKIYRKWDDSMWHYNNE
jgi:hypothetical protein